MSALSVGDAASLNLIGLDVVITKIDHDMATVLYSKIIKSCLVILSCEIPLICLTKLNKPFNQDLIQAGDIVDLKCDNHSAYTVGEIINETDARIYWFCYQDQKIKDQQVPLSALVKAKVQSPKTRLINSGDTVRLKSNSFKLVVQLDKSNLQWADVYYNTTESLMHTRLPTHCLRLLNEKETSSRQIGLSDRRG